MEIEIIIKSKGIPIVHQLCSTIDDAIMYLERLNDLISDEVKRGQQEGKESEDH